MRIILLMFALIFVCGTHVMSQGFPNPAQKKSVGTIPVKQSNVPQKTETVKQSTTVKKTTTPSKNTPVKSVCKPLSNDRPNLIFSTYYRNIQLPAQSVLVEWLYSDKEDDQTNLPLVVSLKMIRNGLDVTEKHLLSSDRKGIMIGNLEEGNIDIYASVVDSKGLSSDLKKFQLSVSPIPIPAPSAVITGPAEIKQTQENTKFGVRFLNDNRDVKYKWTVPQDIEIIGSSEDAELTIGKMNIGRQRLKLTITDQRGRISEAYHDIDVLFIREFNSLPVIFSSSNAIRHPISDTALFIRVEAVDSDGKIMQYQWQRISGDPDVVEVGSDTAILKLTNLKSGIYVYRLKVVDDDRGESEMDFTVAVSSPPNMNTEKTKEKVVVKQPGMDQSVSRQPAEKQPAEKQPVEKQQVKKQPVVKQQTLPSNFNSGPGNAFLNILLPGVGHYKVSGDISGRNRKKGAFLITTMYFACAGGAVYFKSKSMEEYDIYALNARMTEQLYDSRNNVIGIRAMDPSLVEPHFENAEKYNKMFLNFVYAGAGIFVTDFLYTVIKGASNKSTYNKLKKGTLGLNYDPVSRTIQPSISIRF